MSVSGNPAARRTIPLWRIALWGGIALLLLLPAVAMQFTAEVQWTAGDFTVAAMLLIGGGGVYELMRHLVSSASSRAVIGVLILLLVVLIWLQGAVGLT